MSQNNIVFATASELAESIKSRKLSSYEVTLAFYNQIEKYNKTYNAVITLDKDAALKRAREAAALKKRELKELAQKAKALPKKEIEVKAAEYDKLEEEEKATNTTTTRNKTN